jgi:hypothetical protein
MRTKSVRIVLIIILRKKFIGFNEPAAYCKTSSNSFLVSKAIIFKEKIKVKGQQEKKKMK